MNGVSFFTEVGVRGGHPTTDVPGRWEEVFIEIDAKNKRTDEGEISMNEQEEEEASDVISWRSSWQRECPNPNPQRISD